MSLSSTNLSAWVCPSCKLPLHCVSHTWRCDTGHCFDRAKEGYVNLLLAQQKSSKDPGDSKEMIQARHDFLAQQHYLPLVEKLAAILQTQLLDNTDDGDHLSILDSGCGEGYYLNHLYHHLQQLHQPVLATGIDISKFAIQKAAKTHKNAQFAVASAFNLPLATSSQDAVIRVFSPGSSEEVSRVLKQTGTFVLVSPASQHLAELKQFVYDKPVEHNMDLAIPTGFSLLQFEQLDFEFALNTPAERENLLKMTPFYWTIDEKQKLILINELTKVSASFLIRVLNKKAEA